MADAGDSRMAHVTIEYWQAIAISRAADRSSGDSAFEVEVRMGIGRASAFEVALDARGELWLVYSKLRAGRFPNFDVVAAAITTFMTTGEHGTGWVRLEKKH